jgi:hypothetical protein
MNVEIKPTEDIRQLKENLEKRVEDARIDGDKIFVETDDVKTVEKTPGVKEFEYDGETHPGLKGRPVQEEAYAKIESRTDAVKALLATVQGYSLVVLNTDRQWDLKNLKKYNPDIKELKEDEPVEALEIEKTVSDIEGPEKIEIEMPDEDEEEIIYREMLT